MQFLQYDQGKKQKIKNYTCLGLQVTSKGGFIFVDVSSILQPHPKHTHTHINPIRFTNNLMKLSL